MVSSRDLVLDVLNGAPAGVSPFPADYVRAGKSYCQTFAGNTWEEFFDRNTPNSYSNATEAMNAAGPRNMDYMACPPGGWHWYAYGKDGHVAFGLGSGYQASGTGYATDAVESLGKHVYVHRVADYAKHLKYLGWTLTNGNRARIVGLTDPYAVVVAPNQRKVDADSAGVRRRTAPNTGASYDPNANIPANTVVTPDGWITGEAVTGNATWFQIGGLFSHSGSFTDAGTHDLVDLNPKPNTRTVRPDNGVNVRATPSSSGTFVTSLDRGAVVPVTQYCLGEEVTGSNGNKTNVWYLTSGGYAWAGGFTSMDTTGLTKVEMPVPPVTPQYPSTPYTFLPDFGPTIIDQVIPADWSNFENEYSQPDPAKRKGFPANPVADVRHQWGDPGTTLQSVINTFKARHTAGNGVAAHFVVGLDANGKVVIVQMVSLKDRAYHAGNPTSGDGNNYVGIEIDARMTPEIEAAVRKLEKALAERKMQLDDTGALDEIDDHRLEPKYHGELPGAQTACGSYIKPHAAVLDAPYVTPIPPGPNVDTALILAAVAASEARILDRISQLPTTFITTPKE